MSTSVYMCVAFLVIVGASDVVDDIFEDYFAEELKAIDIPQDLAVRSCVKNSSVLVEKLDAAYDACFGADDEDKDSDYDWNDFEENNDGHDSDKDGLSDAYEANEACFYSKMGWVKRKTANEKAILDDFKGIKDIEISIGFTKEIKNCGNWNGDFKRRKREASQIWSINLARNRRASTKTTTIGNSKENRKKERNAKKRQERRKENKRKGKNAKHRNNIKVNRGKTGRRSSGKKQNRKIGNRSGKKLKHKVERKNKNAMKGDRKSKKGQNKEKKENKVKGQNKKNGIKSGGRSKKTKGTNNAKANKGRRDGKKKGAKKVSKAERQTMKELLPESVYNQLWCFEVTVEKALKSCVEKNLKEGVEEQMDEITGEDQTIVWQTSDFTAYSTDY